MSMKIPFLKAVQSHLQFHLYQRWKPSRWSFPVHEFEKETGITGISRDYVIPEGYTATSMGEYLNEAAYRPNAKEALLYHDLSKFKTLFKTAMRGNLQKNGWIYKMVQALNDLEKLNPELQTLEYDRNNVDDMYHVALGICSGFNPDDIQYFVSKRHQLSAEESLNFHAQKMALRRKIGAEMLWVTSPETYKKIKKQAGLENWEVSPDTLQKLKDHITNPSNPQGFYKEPQASDFDI
jgi:hypothetical protein